MSFRTSITGTPMSLVILSKGYIASEDLKVELQEHVKKVTAPCKYPKRIEIRGNDKR